MDQPDYPIIKDYLSDLLRVRVVWHGVIENEAPQEHWKPFRLEVWNIVEKGEGERKERITVKDVDATAEYRTAAEAITAYEDFLVRYSNCEWLPTDGVDENGEPKTIFLEKGNKLKPLSKDIPVADPLASLEAEQIYGSW